MRSYTVAVVGTGDVAGLHAADLHRLAGRARLVAAVDVDPERLKSFAERWSVPRTYPDLTTLLDEERPDLVDLCSPPHLHAGQAMACLARGVTVLCEKPPALSLAQFDAIVRCESTGRFATVFQHRFGSGAAAARRIVGDPRFGPPLSAVCHTLWYRGDEYFAVPWRARWATAGGGPTLGHGIHQIDLLLSILGPWRELVAVASRRARRTETEDVSCAIVTFENGTVATVVNSLLSPRQTSYLRIDFAHATVELEHLYGYDDSDWRVTPAPGHENEIAEAWAAGPTGQPSGHRAQLAAVVDALDRGVPPPVTTAEARLTLEFVAALYASAFTGRRIARGELGPGCPFYDRMDGSGAPWCSG